jgi:hypothetical protein
MFCNAMLLFFLERWGVDFIVFFVLKTQSQFGALALKVLGMLGKFCLVCGISMFSVSYVISKLFFLILYERIVI